ncbi:uncharacterized protein PHALS_09471 [Plasmopara halstedii]|uniref:Isoform h n=1 Tax=Plasmopara halstedii TaxID=4781 RepID=A0A0P1A5G3_PLAHL|nr:uncharacterized protein PHALS_09471 [Plasmopara halstedii]CEG35345.1 isoform h [Plasmopara halstedii]|eukprot:XP_024571714.1 isoform h [Plasmopara halstedii]
MKKMSRKPFRGGPLFSSKASGSTTSHGSSNSSPSMSSTGSNGSTRRTTWADKIREKLPPLGENEYEVLWERGVLGVIFLESEKDGIPYVSKATESCISTAVSQGDILTYVNVVRSKDHSFSDFFKILATMKKPVLLRFERLSASTPSSDDDEASQLFSAQRSGAGNPINATSQVARQNLSHLDEREPTGRLRRVNSVHKDQKPIQATRDTSWRVPNAKESRNMEHLAQSSGSHGSNGAYDQFTASHPHRHLSHTKDHVASGDSVIPNKNGSCSPLNPHEYEVYWETGSLGLFFAENRLTSLPVVTRSTTSANPVVRRTVAVNDTLVSANGVKSADYSFEAFFACLQQMSKPVRLVLRRKQPNEQVVIVKQVGHEQDPKREFSKSRELQQRKQQHIRENHQEQQQREQHQREQQREQHQREQQQREQHQREQQQREQHQREQQQREQHQREQHQREQHQREQQQREQHQREQQQREQQQREQQQLHAQRREQQHEQQQHEKQQREQRQRDQQQREHDLREKQLHELHERKQQECEEQQDNLLQEVVSPVIADSNPATLGSPVHGQPHQDLISSPVVRRASTPPSRPPSPQARRVSTPNNRDSHHASNANMQTSPLGSPVAPQKTTLAKSMSSTNHDTSPRIQQPKMTQSSPMADNSPNIGSSPKVNSSPLMSPSPQSSMTDIDEELSNITSRSSDFHDKENHFLAERKESELLTKESVHIAGVADGRRSRNGSEDMQLHHTVSVVHDDEPTTSPTAAEMAYSSLAESWNLPEDKVLSPSVMTEMTEAEEDIDIAAPVPLNDAHSDMTNHANVAVEPELGGADIADDVEVVEDGLFSEVSKTAEETLLAEEAELAEKDVYDETMDFVEERDPAIPLHSEINSPEDDVEVGMLADAEVEIAIEEIECEVDANDAWDFEQHGSDLEKKNDSSSADVTSRDENLHSIQRRSSIDGALRAESSKVDFADASESADEFTNDRDISSEIDTVDDDIMMRQGLKDKAETSQPRPAKTSLNANLAKYKKKGKTSRGVIKLPALTEEQAQTVPLLAPNAVNTTVQVRGRPKPKSTMADTPDSTTYLVKWKENRSIGLQLKEVRLAKGTYPLIMDVCHEPCCELLRHICVGDVILEINGRNTSTMGVKKTVNFLRTCTKTTLMKIRHGPGFVNERVSATV